MTFVTKKNMKELQRLLHSFTCTLMRAFLAVPINYRIMKKKNMKKNSNSFSPRPLFYSFNAGNRTRAAPALISVSFPHTVLC